MHCPVCRAEVDSGPQCRRCRVDLSLLFILEEQRQQLLTAGFRALGCGRWREALALGERAGALRQDYAAQRLVALAHLLAGEYTRALADHIHSAQ
jgi:hypothetical protein